MPTFTLTRPDGSAEPVAAEPWLWVARYGDGDHLPQFCPERGAFHRFGDIDLERLTALEVRPADGGAPGFTVPMRPGMRPIFFKRHRRLHVGTPNEHHEVLFCFGYQETVGGRNVKCVLTIRPDGEVRIENHDGRPG
jgi:hypothetical protein